MKPSTKSESVLETGAVDACGPAAAGGRRRPLAGTALRLLSDDRLARLAAAGDRLAFAAIFDRYHGELYRYCASLLRNRDDAADALQATMLRALRALDGEQREIAVRPWLYRIAHNESITLLRRPRSEDGRGAEVPVACDVETSAAIRAELRSVLDDIRVLPERQRGALVMRELAGLDYKEIAVALDTSASGAKQAVYDARRALYDLAKGRDSACEAIQRTLSDGDRRSARARSVRAHLRACSECRAFQVQIAARESSLAAFAPVMPAGVAAQAFHGALAGAAGGTVAGGGATTIVGQGVALAAAVAAALGAGAVGVHELHAEDERPRRGVAGQVAPTGPRAEAPARRAAKPRRPNESAARDRGRARARVEARRAVRAAAARRQAAARRRGTSRAAPRAATGGAARGPRVAAPATAGAPAPTPPAAGRGGLRRWVTPGRSSRPGPAGPIRSTVDQTRGTVNGTVDQVQAAVPVPTPEPPRVPVVRPRERR